MFPVSLDTIEYNGATKPPTSIERQPGRPRTKRIPCRSEFLDPEDSPVMCLKCGKRGHNRRSCQSKIVIIVICICLGCLCRRVL